MKTRGTKTVAKRISPSLLIGVLMIVSAALAVPLYSVKARLGSSSPKTAAARTVDRNLSTRATRWSSVANSSLATPLVPFTPAIAIYESDCLTPSTSQFGRYGLRKDYWHNLPVDGRAQAQMESPYGSLAQGAT
jgi:hypothetical protein